MNIPALSSERHKICIICEGNEEYDYLNKLKSLAVWNKSYGIYLDNAGGNGSIPAKYQDAYHNDTYDLVLVFCDTEKKPYEQYDEIKNKINNFHGIDHIADKLIIFANPCTMQIILLHIEDVVLKTPAKKINSIYIEKAFGIGEKYKASKTQRDIIFSKITVENYYAMVERIKKLPSDDSVIGSTNFLKYIEFLTSENSSWIKDINNQIEEAV